MAKVVSFFTSYAHRDAHLAKGLMERFQTQIAPSKVHRYRLWRDTGLLLGEDWRDEIQQAMDGCSFGLLLLSPAFLGSDFIKNVELPVLTAKPLFPVLLKQVDFAVHDLAGLERLQVFFQTLADGSRRSYQGCRHAASRDAFTFELFQQVEARLRKLVP